MYLVNEYEPVCSLESVESSIDMDNFIVNYSIVI